MENNDSHVTIHMAASLDGFIARKDGSVDWMETSDEFTAGGNHGPRIRRGFLKTIDCYVMGSRTYETALSFEAKGLGWAYGDKPTFVLTRRELARTRDSVEFYAGDLAQFVKGRLRPRFRSIWFVGGGVVSGECLRLGLADEVRYSILPVLLGNGIAFFEKLDRDVALHLTEVEAYQSGMVRSHSGWRGPSVGPGLLPAPQTTIARPDDGKTLHAFGDTLQIKLSGDVTNGGLTLGLGSTPQGHGLPPHIHHHEEELFIVLEGGIRFLRDDNSTGPLGPEQ
ncbi:MAG: dihydrofolate reductase family protein [Chthoniobacterales bacterium]|nr:dihydrofolate reductase family protein [Chthoniobacterales bacterium]